MYTINARRDGVEVTFVTNSEEEYLAFKVYCELRRYEIAWYSEKF